MKKYSGILILISIILGAVALICETYLPTVHVNDTVNNDIHIGNIMAVEISRDSVCVIYKIEDYISDETYVTKAVHKVENDTLAYKYTVAGEYIPQQVLKERYRFGDNR